MCGLEAKEEAVTDSGASEIQLFYARVLDRSAKVCFILVITIFLVYVSGVLSPYLPLEDLPIYWNQPFRTYLTSAQVPTGWAWLSYLGYADFLNLLPIAIIAGVVIFAYVLLVFKFFLGKEYLMTGIAFLEIIVLLLAASGFLRGGGH